MSMEPKSDQVRGLVMSIEKHKCIIMTPEGEFRRVSKPSSPVEIGQEITIKLRPKRSWLRPLALVASIFIILLGGLLYQRTLPTAVAYVSLDINPSLELGVDQGCCVVSAQGLNNDGKKLLQAKCVTGQDLYVALAELMEAANQYNYLHVAKENLIFSTVELEKTAPSGLIDEQLVYQTIVNIIDTKPYPVEVAVTNTTPEVRQKACQQGLSTGRYLLYLEAEQDGQSLPAKEVAKRSLKELKASQWSEKHSSLHHKHNPFLEKPSKTNGKQSASGQHKNKAKGNPGPSKNKNKVKGNSGLNQIKDNGKGNSGLNQQKDKAKGNSGQGQNKGNVNSQEAKSQ